MAEKKAKKTDEIWKVFKKTYIVGAKKYHKDTAYEVTTEQAQELLACIGSDVRAATKEEIAESKKVIEELKQSVIDRKKAVQDQIDKALAKTKAKEQAKK